MALFGAVYSTTIITGTEGSFTSNAKITLNFSGYGAFQELPSTYYLYPIWSPPTWSHVNYSAASCIRSSQYTPFNPPPSCVPPPASISANYTVNFIGIVLVLLGVVVMVRGHGQHPTLNTLDQHPRVDST